MKTPTYNMTLKQIQDLECKAEKRAAEKAFVMMLAIPVMIIHDKYSLLMKKEGREERFTDLAIELYDCYEKGYVTMDDFKKILKDECGLTIEEGR